MSDIRPDPPAAPARALDPEPGDWRRVSTRYVVVDAVGQLIGTLVLAAAVAAISLLSTDGATVSWIAPGILVAIGIVLAAFSWRRVRAIGYRERRDDLLVRRGIAFRRFVAVPYGRMQLIDVTQGPIERMLGLAQLKLVTAAASSNVVIPGLVHTDAEALRDRLVELAETRRAGL